MDGALDFMKRKRLNQMAAKQQKVTAAADQLPSQGQPAFGISDCDLGASPQMNKGSLITKMA